MPLLTEPEKLMQYWRDSIAAGQLQPFKRDDAVKIEWSTCRQGHIDPELAARLIHRFEKRRPLKGREKAPKLEKVYVEISPINLNIERSMGSARLGRNAVSCPLIIPAILLRSGQLAASKDHLPWIDRNALEPSSSNEVTIGSLQDYDHYLASHLEPNEGWASLLSYADEMCLSVSDKSIDDFTIEGYERTDALIAAVDPKSHPAKNIQDMADYLIKTKTSRSGTLSSFYNEHERRPTIDKQSRYIASNKHLGQMGGEYPLSAMQREAVHHTIECPENAVLAVNGPPGTGKTTLLHSITANLYVQAALDEADAPVIFMVSTNNQAVTNIIDSFSKTKVPAHLRGKTLALRWLDDFKSHGLYLPSAKRKIENSDYHVAYLPNYGNPLAGFPTELINKDHIDQLELTFLKQASELLGNDLAQDLETTKMSLHTAIQNKKSELKGTLATVKSLIEQRELFNNEPLSVVSEKFVHVQKKIETEILELQLKIESAKAAQNAKVEQLREFEDTCGRALQGLAPSGIWEILVGWLPTFKMKRWHRCKKIMNDLDFRSAPFDQLQAPSLSSIPKMLHANLSNRHKVLEQASKEVESFVSDTQLQITHKNEEIQEKRTQIDTWKTSENLWQDTVSNLFEDASAEMLFSQFSKQDLIKNPELIENCLDIGLRYEMFLLASHYWETRWLISTKNLLERENNPIKALSKRSRSDVEQRFRYLAQMTPCFVSTLYMLPGHLNIYDSKDTTSVNPPLRDFVDLLIVDEAGQVPAEIGAPALALSKRALIVGDIDQIEPVWNVGTGVDHGNLRALGMTDDITSLENAGMLAHNGSLMKIARRFTTFTRSDDDGMFLNEHRRCQTPIISICNDMVYKGRLIPRTPKIDDSRYPNVGWANIRASAIRSGKSWKNRGEADAIAEWLSRQRTYLEQRYQKPMEDVVAIVTPYRPQIGELFQALKKYDIKSDITVGTVHALQGAERELVLFSPVVTADTNARRFFDSGPNMLNVAVSRAQHSFLIFGDARLFDPNKSTLPSGILARHLFRHEVQEIKDVIYRPDLLLGSDRNYTSRIENLKAHQSVLTDAFLKAHHRILITSPFLSATAILNDNVPQNITNARKRNVTVTVIYDPSFNLEGSQLKKGASDGIKLLEEAGATVAAIPRTHNKTLAVDENWIVEGSFNWLSAVREETSLYSRREISLKYDGPLAKEFCDKAWEQIEIKGKFTTLPFS
ncbi:AAA domain-containing protein [Celeribacter sp.]|uniref:AAA domain-containing protein n=1 Tax=Celeribacter sp. TaxID=1890673 RepID=UPI003A9060E6